MAKPDVVAANNTAVNTNFFMSISPIHILFTKLSHLDILSNLYHTLYYMFFILYTIDPVKAEAFTKSTRIG